MTAEQPRRARRRAAAVRIALGAAADFNSIVSANQVIARLDPSLVRQDEARVRQSQAEIEVATSEVNQAQINLDHTVIRSPIDGVTVARNVDVGQTVAASVQAPVRADD